MYVAIESQAQQALHCI